METDVNVTSPLLGRTSFTVAIADLNRGVKGHRRNRQTAVNACPEHLPCLNFTAPAYLQSRQSCIDESVGTKIKVVVHDAEEGDFWAEVPAIPACATQGETMDELMRNLHEAIEGCLAVDVGS